MRFCSLLRVFLDLVQFGLTVFGVCSRFVGFLLKTGTLRLYLLLIPACVVQCVACVVLSLSHDRHTQSHYAVVDWQVIRASAQVEPIFRHALFGSNFSR